MPRYLRVSGRPHSRRNSEVKALDLPEIKMALQTLALRSDHIQHANGKPTEFGRLLRDYFAHRAEALNSHVQQCLMDAAEARKLFKEQKARLSPVHCPLPMNKQKGNKKTNAYPSCLINMLVEANAGNYACDYDPRELTKITRDGMPLRTFSRRLDGAFPSAVDPIAIWEIKEYYYTTTFGSRIADGVYETLLDGMEIEESRASAEASIRHYLFVDSHYTWWGCGKSYLCRLVDMLHMGYVDEILFGREVVERLPQIVRSWVRAAKRQGSPAKR